VTDSDVALVDDAGATTAYAGAYSLEFFDGVSKAYLNATVTMERQISVLPPVDNPTPRCCSGTIRSCC
jgi:hypothetical protein